MQVGQRKFPHLEQSVLLVAKDIKIIHLDDSELLKSTIHSL